MEIGEFSLNEFLNSDQESDDNIEEVNEDLEELYILEEE